MEDKYNPNKVIENAGRYVLDKQKGVMDKDGVPWHFTDSQKVSVSVKNKGKGWWKFGRNIPIDKYRLSKYRDRLGEVIIEYDNEKVEEFSDYDSFWERVKR
jgi:hypothetical protein